jgi:acyl-coenzyme A thioesterase PaaI-like protein
MEPKCWNHGIRRRIMNAKSEKRMLNKPEGHHCFACGTDNPIGLHLDFHQSGDMVCTDIRLGEYHVGWENVAHGGIISTLLDEIMSWAVMVAKKSFSVTRKMNIKYIRNVLIDTPLTVCGKVTDDSDPPKVQAKAEIRDGEGRLLVRSVGEFVLVQKEKLTEVPDKQKQDMTELFKTFD